MKTWLSRTNSVAIALLFLALATPVGASNFGSNTASGGTSAHPCDTSMASECIADNGNHTVYDFNLTADWHTALNHAIVNEYGPVADVTAAWTTSSTTPDVYAADANYGLNGSWGWTLCSGSATFGGADSNRWCKFQWLNLNTSYSQNATQKDAIACHELGHTLGLRHSNESSGSCMIKNQRSIFGISTHDATKLNQQY